MPAFRHAAMLAAVLALGCGPTAAAASDSPGDVYVRIPRGVSDSGTAVTAAAADDFKYVSIEDLVVPNPSRHDTQTAVARDFHLLANGHTYTPVVRKGLEALDFADPQIVEPGGKLHATVTFLVPAGVTKADFEFTPHWAADDGHPADFCCDYP